jgi:hypothetical protein
LNNKSRITIKWYSFEQRIEESCYCTIPRHKNVVWNNNNENGGGDDDDDDDDVMSCMDIVIM